MSTESCSDALHRAQLAALIDAARRIDAQRKAA